MLRGITVPKNGYIYIFCSNESPVDVFFDNLQVTHTKGPLVEETHYYPFGLTMSGISSKAANSLANKKNKFQGQEFNQDLGVDMYEFRYRMADPQTGRFWQIDPLAEEYVYNSTYAFSENKVTGHIELEGLESVSVNDVHSPALRAFAKENVQQHVRSYNNNISESVQVKGNIGFGLGFKTSVDKLQLDASINGPQLTVTANMGGKVSAEGSVAGVNLKGELPKVVEGSAGVNIGVVNLKDGKLTANAATAGVNFESKAESNLTPSKTIKDGNISQTLSANPVNGDVSLGAKLGVIGGEIKVNVIKATSAVGDLLNAGFQYIKNRISESTKIPDSSGRIPN